jgi:hypothetical protein
MINDTLINEMTQNPTICNLAVGTIMGAGALAYAVGRLLVFGLAYYLIYRVTQIFINRYNYNKFPINKKQNKRRSND